MGAWAGWVIAILIAWTGAPAAAGAWLAGEEGQSINTVVFGRREDEGFVERQYYVEERVSDRFAMVIRPLVASGSFYGGSTVRAEGELGLKAAVFRGRNAAVSLQAGAIANSDWMTRCWYGGELRGMGGLSFGGGRGYVNAEFGTRRLNGGCRAHRLDVSTGYRFLRYYNGVFDAFAYAAEGERTVLKIQASILQASFQRSLQIGVRTRVDGGPSETALVFSLWREPNS